MQTKNSDIHAKQNQWQSCKAKIVTIVQNKNSDNRANLDGWLDSTWRRYRHQLWTDSSNIDIKCKNCLWHQIFDTRPGVIFKIITRNVFVLSFADDLFVLIPNFFLQLVVILVPLSTCGWEGFFEMWLFQKVALKLCDWHSETIKSGKLRKKSWLVMRSPDAG